MLILLSLLLTLLASQHPEIARVVVGSKTPNDIPEHVMWDMGFSAMHNMKTRNIEAGLATLPLSRGDAELAFAEAGRQLERREACAKKGDPLFVSFKNDPEKLEKALQAVSLECRWATLEAAERLLAKMSEEGRNTLVNWMLEGRRTITVTVPRGHEKFYRLPR